MARQTLTKEIDGVKYEFYQFGATESLKVLTKLTKIVGRPLSVLLGSIEKGKSLSQQDISGDLLGKAVNVLCERLDEDEVVSIVKKLLSQTMCEGKTVSDVFDTHFMGRLGHMFKVIAGALEAQYGDFFGVKFGIQE